MKAPLFSKRRKKPRLSDCEAKLAALKSENDMLKRHLDTIANKSQKFDQDRKEAESNMKRLLKEGAGPEKLNPLLSKFSQMYSDYGSNRHQELTFHLEQLERLAAPTNFTKMGLWTLGQNEGFYTDLKRNPIASILSKELGINPQQGRKILEQRQKIRDLSSNLKECLGLLTSLKSLCEHKQRVFHDRMSKCQEILTPLQVSRMINARVILLKFTSTRCNSITSRSRLSNFYSGSTTIPTSLRLCVLDGAQNEYNQLKTTRRKTQLLRWNRILIVQLL